MRFISLYFLMVFGGAGCLYGAGRTAGSPMGTSGVDIIGHGAFFSGEPQKPLPLWPEWWSFGAAVKRGQSVRLDKLKDGRRRPAALQPAAMPATEDYLMGLNKESVSLTKLLASFKGKMVLLDLWASWCRPCLSEMPFESALLEKHKNDPIVFLFISLDRNYADWVRGTRPFTAFMQDSNSFMMLNYPASHFLRQYRVSMIPRYMLIAPDGKVISADAPRPDSPRLEKLIDGYLKRGIILG